MPSGLQAQEFGYAGIEETSEALVALLTSLPFGAAAAWMLLTARHSKKTGEKVHGMADAVLPARPDSVVSDRCASVSRS